MALKPNIVDLFACEQGDHSWRHSDPPRGGDERLCLRCFRLQEENTMSAWGGLDDWIWRDVPIGPYRNHRTAHILTEVAAG